MKDIKNENGYLLYTVTDFEITLDNIKVYEQRKGTGRKMIEELKDLARELQLPIGLYMVSGGNLAKLLMRCCKLKSLTVCPTGETARLHYILCYRPFLFINH